MHRLAGPLLALAAGALAGCELVYDADSVKLEGSSSASTAGATSGSSSSASGASSSSSASSGSSASSSNATSSSSSAGTTSAGSSGTLGSGSTGSGSGSGSGSTGSSGSGSTTGVTQTGTALTFTRKDRRVVEGGALLDGGPVPVDADSMHVLRVLDDGGYPLAPDGGYAETACFDVDGGLRCPFDGGPSTMFLIYSLQSALPKGLVTSQRVFDLGVDTPVAGYRGTNQQPVSLSYTNLAGAPELVLDATVYPGIDAPAASAVPSGDHDVPVIAFDSLPALGPSNDVELYAFPTYDGGGRGSALPVAGGHALFYGDGGSAVNFDAGSIAVVVDDAWDHPILHVTPTAPCQMTVRSVASDDETIDADALMVMPGAWTCSTDGGGDAFTYPDARGSGRYDLAGTVATPDVLPDGDGGYVFDADNFSFATFQLALPTDGGPVGVQSLPTPSNVTASCDAEGCAVDWAAPTNTNNFQFYFARIASLAPVKQQTVYTMVVSKTQTRLLIPNGALEPGPYLVTIGTMATPLLDAKHPNRVPHRQISARQSSAKITVQ